MSFIEGLFSQVAAFTGTLTPALVLTIFLITAIGEFATGIPYLLETIWLSTGYFLITGAISPAGFGAVVLAAESGRMVGAAALYSVARAGSGPIIKLYMRILGKTVSESGAQTDSAKTEKKAGWRQWTPVRFMKKIDYLSPFSVAIGRLLWLRIPLTLTLAARKDWKTLLVAVLMQGTVWDLTYVTAGAILGATFKPSPGRMVLFSLAGLTLFYTITMLVRWLRKPRRAV